ncbi:hypothetical protein [Lysinibacillus capsici]|uniref:hypothetical protein n=1 Tax=Lysinibacillus capsici TaxID=2115968 RepID=UPI00289F8618|nr:hypothetical protein [Lysinibacillus capsici]
MKKALKFGCLGALIGLILMIVLIMVIGGNSNNEDNKSEKDKEQSKVIIDATQFSRINTAKLVEIMGEPESIDEYMWLVPSTGKEIPAKTYIYENNRYEFMVIEDTVTRMNVYSGKYMGYDDTTLKFKNEDDLFAIFNIKTNQNLKKIADTGAALRYTPVSDNIAELWVVDIEENSFGVAKITYNLNYY